MDDATPEPQPPDASPAPSRLVPTSVGRYRVLRELGRGAMGVVYEVRSPDHPERALALKLILGAVTPEALIRFQREAEVLARVRHRGVVVVHELGRLPEGPFLLTDLVAGTGLETLLREGLPEPRRAAEIVRGLADALAAVHAQGVLHRDLKPANVMLRDGDGTPVLLDFGIAGDAAAGPLTTTGTLVGSPAYMSPEQASGQRSSTLDERTDVYGLGAVLYALLTGHAPYGGGTLENVLTRVLTESPRRPSADRRGVPRELEAICRMAMAREQGDRYGSAGALRADLDRFLRGERTEAGARFARRGRLLVFAAVVVVAALATWGLRTAAPAPEATGTTRPRTSPAPTPPATSPPPATWAGRRAAGEPWSAEPDLVLVPVPDDRRRVVHARFLDDRRVVTVDVARGEDAADVARVRPTLRVWDLAAPAERTPPAPQGVVLEGLLEWLDLAVRDPDHVVVVGQLARPTRRYLAEVSLERGVVTPLELPPEWQGSSGEAVAPVGTSDVLLGAAEHGFDVPQRSVVLRLGPWGPPDVVAKVPRTIWALAVHGRFLATASADGEDENVIGQHGYVTLFDLETGEQLQQWVLLPPWCLAFDPGAARPRLAAGLSSGELRLLDLGADDEGRALVTERLHATEQEREEDTRSIVERAHRHPISALVYGGGALWTAGRALEKKSPVGGELRAWRQTDLSPLPDRTLGGPGSAKRPGILSVDVSPDGRLLVVGDEQGSASVWILPRP